ncbi:hypothetical protein K431DRAFT_26157 [Polychaeton citri CBS 116435]|uniref:DUF8032 domain-containing protein n=1 Tax=Polychaeton citri CBS 116435 TaxID=1314669 RepID=A0A9P4PYG9_9PEZI|nr:hypothetical protein K431DRAFT_26157 [Polychaeton citri CBS 116435]
MAAQAAMSRQQFPPIASYQTPQSNSPASIHSPQTDAQGRPIYSSIPSMPQAMYYQTYQPQQQSPYSQPQAYAQQQQQAYHPATTAAAPGMLASYQQHHHQQLPPVSQPHQPSHPQPPQIDAKPPHPQSLPRPPSSVGPQSSPQTPSGPGMSFSSAGSAGPNPNAAPGPIPATTPLVVREDNNGVQWIAFEYSRDRVKMEYTIRCDVESVNQDELSQDFKSANCVYPRACVGKENYKGNRLAYETECNTVGWALAHLNPNLREKRGLIQRAVDSWRNSNRDPRLRSRRVRRIAKMHNRKTTQPTGPALPGSQLPGPQGVQGLHGMPPSARPPGMPIHHGMQHHGDGNDAAGHDDVTASNEYSNASAHHHSAHQPPSAGRPDLVASPNTSAGAARYAHNFYPTYPQQPAQTLPSNLPPPPIPSAVSSGQMRPMHRPQSSTATTSGGRIEDASEEEIVSQQHLFGDLPEAKRRKFILVDDNQRGTRVRVRVMLDQVKMDDMPDAHLRTNAVFPRSYFPRQMRSPSGRAGGANFDEDEDDLSDNNADADASERVRGKTLVPVSLMDGSETKLSVPRMAKSRRVKEVCLNELGYRMSWGQARTFNGRTLFLQRSLDAYRNKMRSTMLANGNTDVASHFETRPGKRKWLERSSTAGGNSKQQQQQRARASSPPAQIS